MNADTKSTLITLMSVIEEYDVPSKIIIEALPLEIIFKLMLMRLTDWVDQQSDLAV